MIKAQLQYIRRDLRYIGDFFFGGGVTLKQSVSIKAIVCLYIVIGHWKSYCSTGWFGRLGGFAWIDGGIFFLISGYGLTYEYLHKKDYFNNFHRRFAVVIVRFLMAHIVYALVNSIFGVRFTVGDLLNSIIGNSTLVRNDWFVPSLLFFYLAFSIVFKRKQLNDNKKISFTVINY